MTLLPTISVLIPTLNAERYIGECLTSVRAQIYPADRIGVVIADGGSTDGTLEIAKSFGVERILRNDRVTAEAARALLVNAAAADLVLSIDADNYLVGTDWLLRMVAPLEDPTIFASEAVRWHYDPTDASLNRYFALSGVNDPVSLFLGNYGRFSYLTGKWTECEHDEEVYARHVVATLCDGAVPTLGANGFLARTRTLQALGPYEYYFDIDVVAQLVAVGHKRIARVDVEVGHHFARDLPTLSRKTRRRAEDYLHWRGRRTFPWVAGHRWHIVRFVVSTLLILPILLQAWRGYRAKPDLAWLWHVPVCWLTLLIYLRTPARHLVNAAPHSRKRWTH